LTHGRPERSLVHTLNRHRPQVPCRIGGVGASRPVGRRGGRKPRLAGGAPPKPPPRWTHVPDAATFDGLSQVLRRNLFGRPYFLATLGADVPRTSTGAFKPQWMRALGVQRTKPSSAKTPGRSPHRAISRPWRGPCG
jgi:hypothetical protein